MFTQILIATGVLLVTYLLRKLYTRRFEQFANFPQHPPSMALGHLATIDEFLKKQPPKAHADMALAAMHEALGRPSVMFVDLQPAGDSILVIGNYEAAEQLVKTSDRWPYTPPKPRDVWKRFEYLTGPTSIVSTSGEEWKTLRKRFNPGFATKNMMELLPCILEKASLFADHLNTLASSNEVFKLQDYTTNLTFDIIGRVVLNIDMDAQEQQPTAFMQVFRELVNTYSSEKFDLPWWCRPHTEWKRYHLNRNLRENLRTMVKNHYAESSREGNFNILSMSLHNISSLTPELVDSTCDQLLSFLFAGHDTTSTLISWAFYELSRTPHALRAVRTELDELFGLDPSPSAVQSKILGPGGKELIHRMSYTMAVIKETLRLWPPAGTSRLTKPGDGFTIHTPNGELCVDGLQVYQVHYIIQRDPKAFGDTADKFVPERWLHDVDKIPVGAWRPFERGPRNCIGQELATIEARIAIALVARQFDFIKVGRGALALDTAGNAVMGDHGQYNVESEMYMTRQVTSKPVDSMMMRVKIRQSG